MPTKDHFRAESRRQVSLEARLRREVAGPERTARVVDLGLSGACVELDGPVEPDAAVILEIVAPTLWDPLVLSGRIAWVRYGGDRGGARAGVEFEHPRSAALFSLFELLDANAFES